MIDYRIPTFLTLYELMNYRRTAEQLKLSQPAVTQQIHALERDYGCRLFTYDGSRLYRTPEAEKLLSSLKLTSAIFIPNLLKKAIVSRISA